MHSAFGAGAGGVAGQVVGAVDTQSFAAATIGPPRAGKEPIDWKSCQERDGNPGRKNDRGIYGIKDLSLSRLKLKSWLWNPSRAGRTEVT